MNALFLSVLVLSSALAVDSRSPQCFYVTAWDAWEDGGVIVGAICCRNETQLWVTGAITDVIPAVVYPCKGLFAFRTATVQVTVVHGAGAFCSFYWIAIGCSSFLWW